MSVLTSAQSSVAHVTALAEALDGIGVALCLFDGTDRTVLWNATFLSFFPEHDGHVHAGESYRDNLYRFYDSRLTPEERVDIDRHVESGIARHRTQSRPFVFKHRGRVLRVSSILMPDGGRTRVWTSLATEQPRQPPSTSSDLFANLADGAMILDPSGRIVAVNEEFRSLYDLASVDEAKGLTLADIVRGVWAKAATAQHPDQPEANGDVTPFLDDARFAGAAFELELPGMRWRRVIERRLADGTSYLSHADISVPKQQQRDLAAANRQALEGEERYRLLTENSGDIIVSLREGEIIEFASPAVTRVLGWLPLELTSRPISSLIHPADLGAFQVTLTANFDQASHGVTACRLRHSTAERNDPAGWVWVEAHVRIVTGPTLQPIQAICSFRDITRRIAAETALREAHQRVAALVGTDPLTGIANRRRFEEVLQRYGPGFQGNRLPLSLLLIDIDHFKRVNDEFGHQAGDACLMMVAETIERLVPPGDTLVARFGGEEFAAVLPGSDTIEAAAIAERVRAEIASDRNAYSQRTPVTVSIGIACTVMGDPERSGMDALVALADAAMYRAKREGRNQVAIG